MVAIPTIPAIVVPPTPRLGTTFAPTKGATPRPPVDPSDTMTPPLGSWFWFTSVSLVIKLPLDEVIPVNTTLVDVPPTSVKS